MDEIMDTKVVQMKFDNSQFRAGVQDTIKQLENLENSLELQGASDGLDNVAKASKRTIDSMGDMSNAVDEVQRHFSALEVVGITVMMRLTNSVLDYSKRTVSKLWSSTIGQVISGGKLRSQNISNAKFQLEGLGVAWKDISEDIDYGVKDTAYGLDEAAKVASQLVASQVELGDEMKKSLRAISGVAAMTNAQYSEIGHIFTTVASNGKLMTMQLRELSNRGLNASAQIAKYFREVRGEVGATEESINNMVSKGQIDFQTFAEAMDWAFGAHAKEANKTFQGVMSNVRSALSRIGAKFADPVYENLRRILEKFIPVINKINTALTPIVNVFSNIADAAATWMVGFLKIEDISRGIMQIVINLYSYLRPVLIAFVETFAKYFPKIDKETHSLENFTKKFLLTVEAAEKVTDVFKTIFSSIDLLIHLGSNGLKLIFTLLKGIGGLIGGIINSANTKALNSGISLTSDLLWKVINALQILFDIGTDIVKARIEQAFQRLSEALQLLDWNKIWAVVSKIMFAVVIAWEVLTKLISLVIHGFVGLIPILKNATTVLAGFVGAAVYGLSVVGALIAGIFGKGRQLITGAGSAIGNLINRSKQREQEQHNDTRTEQVLVEETLVEEVLVEDTMVEDRLEETTQSINKIDDSISTIRKNAQRGSKDIERLSVAFNDLNDNAKNVEETLNKPHAKGQQENIEDAVNRKSQEILQHPSNTDEMGFFETIAAYFIGNEDNVIYIISQKVDEFFKTVYFAFSDVYHGFIDKVKDLVSNISISQVIFVAWNAAKIATAIGTGYLIFRLLRGILGIIDFLPSLARSLSKVATGYLFRSLGQFFKDMAVPIIAMAASFAIIMVAIDRLDVDVDEFEKIMGSIIKLINTLSIFFGILLGIQFLGSLPAISNILKGQIIPLSQLGLGILPGFFKSLGILIAAVAGSMFILDNISWDDTMKEKIKWTFGMIGGFILSFSLLAKLFSFKLEGATDSLTVSRLGITRNVKSFANMYADIFIGISLVVATFTASIFALSRIDDMEKVEQLSKMLITFVTLIGLISIGLAASMQNVHPSTAFNVYKSVRAMQNMLNAISFMMLALAGTMRIMQDMQIDSYNREAFIWYASILGGIILLSGIITLFGRFKTIITKETTVSRGLSDNFTASIIATLTLITVVMVALAGVMKVLDTVDWNNMQGSIGPILAILAPLTVMTGLLMGLSTLAKVGPILSVAGVFIGLATTLAALGYMFGQIKKIPFHAITNFINKYAGWIVEGIIYLEVVIAAIITLAAIPVTAAGLTVVFAVLMGVFFALAGVFFAAGYLANSIGRAVEKITDAIRALTEIDWEIASESSEYFIEFAKNINKGLRKLKNIRMGNVIGLGLVSKAIADSVKVLSDVTPEAAVNAAKAMSNFIETLADKKQEVREVKRITDELWEMSQNFAKIAWMVALGAAGLTIAAVELVATTVMLGAFAGLMYLFGDKIEPALKQFIDAMKNVADYLSPLVDTLFWAGVQLIAIGALWSLGAFLINVAATLLWAASGAMNLASTVMSAAFETFLDELDKVGVSVNKHYDSIMRFIPLLTKLGLAMIGSGIALVIGSGLYALTGIIISGAVALIASGLEQAAEHINNFIDLLAQAVERYNELKSQIEEAGEYNLEEGGIFQFGSLGMFVDSIAGLIDAIHKGNDEVEAAAYEEGYDTGEAYENGTNDSLEINSPSKKFMAIVGYCADGIVIGTKNNSEKVIAAGKMMGNNYISGLDAKGIETACKTVADNATKAYSNSIKAGSIEVGRESNQFAQQQGEQIVEGSEASMPSVMESGAAMTTTYSDGEMEGLQNSQGGVRSAINSFLSMFGIDISNLGMDTVHTWFSGFLEQLGIDMDGATEFITSIGAIGGALFGDGFGAAVDEAFHAIARMARDQFSETQQNILATLPDAALGSVYRDMENANEQAKYWELKHGWDEYKSKIPSIDDLLGGLGGSTPSYSAGSDYTSDLASSISGSSGAGSGINDVSKSSSIGGGIGNTITNSNNTYNFTQNNYSPEALNRSEIYTQTRNQFNTFYGFMRDKNPAF